MASFHRCNILIFIVLVALSTTVALAYNQTNIPASSTLSEFISAEVENGKK